MKALITYFNKIKFLITGKPVITLADPQEAFELALKNGWLSSNSEAKNFVGNYMYMQTINDEHRFKSITTREYLN